MSKSRGVKFKNIILNFLAADFFIEKSGNFKNISVILYPIFMHIPWQYIFKSYLFLCNKMYKDCKNLPILFLNAHL